MYTMATWYINPFVRATIDPLRILQHTCDFDFTVVFSAFQDQVPTTKTVKIKKKIGNEYSAVLFHRDEKKNIITTMTEQQSTHYVYYGSSTKKHHMYT